MSGKAGSMASTEKATVAISIAMSAISSSREIASGGVPALRSVGIPSAVAVVLRRSEFLDHLCPKLGRLCPRDHVLVGNNKGWYAGDPARARMRVPRANIV